MTIPEDIQVFEPMQTVDSNGVRRPMTDDEKKAFMVAFKAGNVLWHEEIGVSIGNPAAVARVTLNE